MPAADRESEGIEQVLDDGLTLRAAAQGHDKAVTELVERHTDHLYGLLRMVLPSASDAEEALAETFVAAFTRGVDGRSAADTEPWLVHLALEQVAIRCRPSPPISFSRQAAHRRPGTATSAAGDPEASSDHDETELLDAKLLAGVTDESLAVMVRTMDLRARQALVLSTRCGLEDTRVASILGCDVAEVRRLRAAAFAALRAKLLAHAKEEQALKYHLSTRNPYRLGGVPSSVGAEGAVGSDTQVHGTEVRLAAPRPQGLVAAFIQAVRRVMERWQRRHEHKIGEDDAGKVGRPQALDPTPSLRPMRRPDPTPSMTDYRTPRATPGMATYQSPKSTPSTGRLSPLARPLPAGVSWSSLRHPRRQGR